MVNDFESEALEKLSEENIGLIERLVNGYTENRVSYERMYLHATHSYARAINSYDEEKHEDFVVFATEIIEEDLEKAQKKEVNILEKEREPFTQEEKEQVARENTRLIHHVAKNYNHGTLSYDDIVSAGTYGYAKAIENFDKSLGVQFSTFATTCIRNEILTFLNKERKHLEGDVSMSSKLVYAPDSDLELGDTLANKVEFGADVEGKIILKEDMRTLMEAVMLLHPRERFIIENRYELNGRRLMTQEEIGKVLNRTQAGISKMEQQIMEKLKGILKGKIVLENSSYYNGGVIDPIRYTSL